MSKINKIFLRKGFGDYEDSNSGKVKSGEFWRFEVDGIDRGPFYRPGSWSRKKIVSMLKSNFGENSEIFEQVA